jgi:transposase-like protein
MPTTVALRSPFNVPRWTEAQAREVIAALERSGKPVSVFAAEHGLDPQRVYQWRRRVAGGDGTMFREIVVRRSDHGAQGSVFEVVLATGDIVRVPPSFDPAALVRLLEVLRTRAC